MIELKQTWWYIEDRLPDTRIARQIMDIFTDQQFLEIPVDNIDFEGLEIRCKNLDRELAYIEKDGKIIASLANLDDLPTAPDQENPNIKHLRLEIEYMLLNQNFKMSWGSFSYIGGFQIDEFVQPEFYIKLPPGMEIEEDGRSFKMFFYQECGEKEDTEEIKFESQYIAPENHYNYLINPKEYLRLKDEIKEDCMVGFRIIYKASVDWRLFLFPLIGLVFIALSIARISQLIITPEKGNPAYYLRILVLLISYSGFVYKFHSEGYNIPLLKIAYTSIAFLILLTICEILFS